MQSFARSYNQNGQLKAAKISPNVQNEERDILIFQTKTLHTHTLPLNQGIRGGILDGPSRWRVNLWAVDADADRLLGGGVAIEIKAGRCGGFMSWAAVAAALVASAES